MIYATYYIKIQTYSLTYINKSNTFPTNIYNSKNRYITVKLP